MRVVSVILILLLFAAAGCEKEKNPADLLPDSSIELTDGYCLVAGDQVMLNHHDIDYYDYGTHLVYLKSHCSLSEILEKTHALAVWAGGEEVYPLTIQPGYSSYAPVGPMIWTDPTFYPDHVISIYQIYTYDVMLGNLADCRDDSRIVKALQKYGQYREGLQCEIDSIRFLPSGEVVLELELRNDDPVNYYYLDPLKMGRGLFHYFTNGLSLYDEELAHSYDNQVEHIQPEPWDSWELEWMSVLESQSSVNLSISYDNFDAVPPGSYTAIFRFPGLSHVEREDMDQKDGRIWLGELQMNSKVFLSSLSL